MQSQRFLQQAHHYLHSHLSADFSAARMAADFGISPGHLSHLFRRHSGVAMREYLAGLRIKASFLPLIDNKPVIWAQQEAGYSHAPTFTRQFQSFTGLSPLHYRALLQPLHHAVLRQQDAGQPLLYQGFCTGAQPAGEDTVTVRLTGCGSAASMVFIGWYDKPMARGKAVFGTIVCHHGHSYEMPQLPAGMYYPIAVEIAAGVDRNACFFYRHARRTADQLKVHFPCAEKAIVLPLAPPSAHELLPPVPVNLPLLLHHHLRGLPDSA